MALIISRPLFVLFSCEGEPPSPKETPSESVHTAESGHLPTADTAGPTGSTAHTGTLEGPQPITLLGDDALDFLGRSVDAADIDGDGRAEIAVAAPWEGYYEPGESSVHYLVYEGLESGIISDEALATWQQPEVTDWAYHVALLPGQIAFLSNWDEIVDGEHNKHAAMIFDLPAESQPALIDAAQRAGEITIPDIEYYSLGFVADIENCSTLSPPTLCLSSNDSSSEQDFAGAIWLFEIPIESNVPIDAVRTKIYGNYADSASIIKAGHDLDGDGLGDIVIGAYSVNNSGRVGLVSAPDAGDFLLWDIAWATLDGEALSGGGYAGSSLEAGDLNGDGYFDAFVGAQANEGRAYVALGPFSGSLSLSEATHLVEGEVDEQWVGVDGAIGDMDGDGSAELVVGAPHSYYFNNEPGTVAIFQSPAPGSYGISDASITLVSGSDAPDAFGLSIAPADIDGDGLMDLAIGAPDDPRNGALAGSLTLVFGASL